MIKNMSQTKSILYGAFFLMLTLLSVNTIQAQEKNNDKINYVVLTKKIPQLQPILLAAEALKAEDGAAFGDFQIIICGKEIGDITAPEKVTKFLNRADELGVQIIACGFSLNKFKVDRAAVPKDIKIVENGILHNLQLQKKGYKSITL